MRALRTGERFPAGFEQWLVDYSPQVVNQQRWCTEIRPFVLPLLRKLSYASLGTLKRSTRELLRIVEWSLDEGMALDIDVILDPDTVERFTQVGMRGVRSAGTYRSVLRSLGPLLTTTAPWSPPTKPVNRRGIAPPYTPSQIAMLRNDVRHQASEERRRAGRALLALGLGAGLDGRWSTKVRAADLIQTETALVVKVGDPASRSVPVLAAWESELETLAALAGDEPLVGPTRKGKNAANAYTSMVQVSDNTPRLNAGRLRATWLVHHIAAGTRLPELAHAAGLVTVTVLSDLMEFVPLLPEPEINLLLRDGQ